METSELLRQHVEALCTVTRNRRNPLGISDCRTYLQHQLETAGWEVTRRPFTIRWSFGVSDRTIFKYPRLYRRIKGMNLLAHPAAVSNPSLLVIAHYDAVYGSPGADDNASGIAVLLATASLLAQHESSPQQVEFVLADLEEIGLLGSRALAKQIYKTTTIRNVIGLESVGFFSNETGSQKFPAGSKGLLATAAREVTARNRKADFLAIVGRRSSQGVMEIVTRSLAAHGLAAIQILDPRPDGWRSLPATLRHPLAAHFDRSDHQPFWRRGIPAVMVTDTATFRNPNYHRKSDRPETLDYERLARLTHALVDIIKNFSN